MISLYTRNEAIFDSILYFIILDKKYIVPFYYKQTANAKIVVPLPKIELLIFKKNKIWQSFMK